MLEGFLVSNIFYSGQETKQKLNFKFKDLLPCNGSLQSKKRKKGIDRIEREIDVVKFVRHQLLAAEL